MSEYLDNDGTDYSEVAPPRPTLRPVHGEWSGTDLVFTEEA